MSKIIKKYNGHMIMQGSKQGEIRNSFKLIKSQDGKAFYLMEDNKGNEFKFDILSLAEIFIVPGINGIPTWFMTDVGYISCKIPNKNNLYLHQHLTNHKGHGKGQDSVDHINQDKLDNRMNNLRIVSQSVQNHNRPRKKRPNNAQPLPENFNDSDLPKYVTYYYENYAPSKFREFFRIEGHPNLNKSSWSSSKSNKIDIQLKFDQTLCKIRELNGEEEEDTNLKIIGKEVVDLPDFCRAKRKDGEITHLIYDERIDQMTKNLRMKYNNDISFEENCQKFINKIKKKYQ